MKRSRAPSAKALAVFSAFLSEPSDWRHGYDLMRACSIASGTLYPMLMRLAEQGFLETRWSPPEQEGRPPRHGYRLTRSGEAHARRALHDARPAKRRGLAETTQTAWVQA